MLAHDLILKRIVLLIRGTIESDLTVSHLRTTYDDYVGPNSKLISGGRDNLPPEIDQFFLMLASEFI